MSYADFKILGLSRNPTSLYMWGDNTNGLLGDNGTPSYFSWSKISSGGLHTVAIRSDGLLFAWGRNTEGQLGTNDTVHRSSPVQLSSTNSWLQVGAGLSHTIAINSDYTLYAWGGNRYGQLGDNTTVNKSLPALVGTSSWSVVTAGGNHTVGIKTDNTVFAWGYNGSGQLGDSTISNRSSPVQIGASALLSPTAYSTYFNGTNYVTVSPGANAVFGANPFTIEMWVYHTQTTSLGIQVLAGQNTTSPGGGTSWLWVYDPVQGQAYFQDNSYSSSWLNANIGGISPNQWHHLAIAKDTPSTDSIRMYVDGIQVMIRTGNMNSQNIGSSGDPLGIAGNGRSTPWLGYITNVRITKNQALFAADTSFTPSINPLTTTTVGATGAGAAASLTGTVLLLAEQNTTQLDNSVNAYAITTVGATPAYSLYTPFTSAIPTGSLLALKIAAGKSHTIAITNNNILYTWGDNTYGELGDGTTNNRSSPVQIGSSSWSVISAGGTHTAAIKTDSTLYTWGLNSSGQLGLNNSYSGSYWTQISEGPVHTLAIRNDGTLWSWGLNTQGQLGLSDTLSRSSPTQVSTSSWTSIDTGDNHSVAIRSDGKLFTWGSNLFGQLGNNPTLTNITWSKISISSMNSYVVAIKSDGTLWSWGANSQGQLGQGDVVFRSSPTQIGALNTWIDAAAGSLQSLGLLNNNVMYAWGYNAYGQLGDNSTVNKSSPIVVGYNFQKVFAGNHISSAIDLNNYLYTWGYNGTGAVGDGTTVYRSSPVQIGTSTWTTVNASDHILALKIDNTLYAWGTNTNGQLGLGDLLPRSSPVQVGTSSWSSISAGASHSVAIRNDGSLFTWGYNLQGQLGLNDVTDRNSPVQVGATQPANTYSLYFKGVASNYVSFNNNTTVIARAADWTVEAWVYIFSYGQRYPIFSMYSTITANQFYLYIDTTGYLVMGLNAVDNITLSSSNTTTIVPLNVWVHVAFCRQGSQNLNNLYINGNLSASGYGGGNVAPYDTGTTSTNHYIGFDGVSVNFYGYISNLRVAVGVQVYTGTYFTVPTTMLTSTQGASTNISAITGTQTILLTAQNSSPVDNSSFARTLTKIGSVPSSTLFPFSTLTSYIGSNWLTASAGASHTTAINSVGNLYSWGNNVGGLLGLGDTLQRSSPTQIGTSTWSSVNTGLDFSIAVRGDGQLYAWGLNRVGQTSDYTTISRSSPVQINTTTANTSSPVQIGTSSWSSISAGGSHTVAITNDGQLFGWGRNFEGQLGGQTNTLGTIWNKVVIGQSHALGIRSDGKLYAWGSNTTGQLGDNTIVAKSSPVLIDNGTWSDIAISQGSSLFYSMGIKSDGRLYAWGNNSVGQLGWLSWRQISVGSGHTLLLRSDGQLYAWGLNNAGQLGDLIAGTTNRSSPIQIGTSTWSTIAAGTSVSAAILSDGRLFAWGYNNNGAVGDGSTTSRSSPVQIATASWSQLSAKDYIMATNTQGSLFVWGNNNNGQLGIGTTLSRKAPQLIDGAPITYSVAFSGVTEYLSIASSAVFGFGTGDFTVEYWVYSTSWATLPTVVDLRAASNGLQWSDNFSATGAPGIYYNSVQQLTSTILVSLNTWAHIAYTRIGTSIKVYVNGIVGATGTSSFDLQSTGICRIGTNITNANPFSGFVSNVRIIKGLGVYTGNFIVPTTVLAATQSNAGVNIADITGTQTVLLTCQNSTIIDNSPTIFTITQVGTPTTTALNPFSNITTGSTSWTQIAAGTASLAINNTGSLFTWGQNNYGQLGSNTTTNRSSPVQVGSGSWIAISSSNTGHSLGVDSTYSLYAWGNNQYGELGTNNEYISFSSPVQILAGYSITLISAGNNSSLAGSTNNNINTIYTWGLNQANQLNNINAFTWQSVKTNSGIQASIGSTVGKLYVWGDNTYGQQGVGDTLTRSSPVQVGGFNGLSTIRFTVNTPLNTAYITNDNSLYMMGDNTYGQLGQSDTIARSSPVLVGVVNAGNWSTVAISGTGHVIAVTFNGTLFAWGNNQYNELGQIDNVIIHRSSPTQIGTGQNWTKVSAGHNFSAAIDSTGTGYLWGRNDIGQVGSIIPLSYTQLTAYGVVRNDGKLLTWGNNTLGNLGTNDTINRSTPIQISTLILASTSWVQVAGAYNNMAGIKIDRKLYLWGDNTYGQLGVSDNTTRSQPVQIGVSSWTQVYVTNSNVYAIRSDSTLWSWGRNNLGQLGLNDTIDRSSPVQIGANNWSMVVASGTHTLALRTDGTLYAWGYNQYNELGQIQRVQVNYSSPVQVGTSSFVTISAGTNNSFAIRGDGGLFGWGRNDYGQIGTNNNIPLSWTTVTGGDSYSVALRSDGKLFSWGRNDKGQLGLGHTVSKSAPTQIATSTNTNYYSTSFNGTTDFLSMPGSTGLSLGTNNFTVECWIYNTATQLTTDKMIFSFWGGAPATDSYQFLLRGTSNRIEWQIYTQNSPDVALLYVPTNSWNHLAWVRSDTTIYSFINGVLCDTSTGVTNSANGSGGTAYVGAQTNTPTLPFQGYISNLRIVKGQALYTSNFIPSTIPLTTTSQGATASNVSLLTCQNSAFIDNSTTPNTITSTGTGIAVTTTIIPFSYTTPNYSFTQVSATLSHTVAIRSDGALWAWGDNSTGQLSQNDTVNRSIPIQIGSSSWTSVFAGRNATYLIGIDGSLFTVGDNTYGQLGQNDNTNRSSIVQVGTSSWTTLSVSQTGHVLGVLSTGALFAWGNNSVGQTGLNDIINRSSPVQVGTSSWTKVSAGNSFSAAITSLGGLFTWGLNNNGQLGSTTTVNRSSPVQVGTSSWIQINAGSSWTGAIDSIYRLFTWGAGVNGEQGSGATASRSSPVQIPGTNSWTLISGNTHDLGIDITGRLFVWGSATQGQLGDNTTVAKSSPVQTGSLTGITFDNVSSPTQIGTSSWTVVNAGDYFTNAIRYGDGGLFTWGLNSSGQLGGAGGGATTGSIVNRSSPSQVGASSWITVSSQGTSNTVAVSIAYTLFGWGTNNYGQVGDNTTVNRSSPVQVGATTGLFMDIMKSPTVLSSGISWTVISAGDSHAMAIRSDTTLWAWGKNDQGQLGTGTTAANRSSPGQVGAGTWSVISAGNSITGGITTAGSLQTTGLNASGQQGAATVIGRSAFTAVGTSSWTQISAGANSMIGTTVSNIVFTWGQNDKGQLGLNDTLNRSSPTQLGSNLLASMYQTIYPSPVLLSTGSATSWTQIGIGDSFSAGVDTAGRLYTWGFNAQGQLGDNSTINTVPTKSSPSQIATTASSYTFINTSSPVQVGSGNWKAVAIGATHTVAVRTDGTLYGWGVNTYGQTGTLNTITQTYPRQIEFTNSWTSVAAGNDFSAAITTTNGLWRWGYYASNELAAPYRSAPMQIDNNSYSKVSIVNNTAFAITTGGALYGWGKITTDDNFYFNQIIATIPWATNQGYSDVNAGDSFVHVIRNDNTVWTTGANGFGQLGVNDTVTRSSIVQIGSGYSWTLLGGGFNPALNAGSLFVTGNNATGQLGLNDLALRSSPTQVSATNQPLFAYPNRLGISQWSSVSAGGTHTVAIRSDSTLWGWGLNTSGQVGDITILSRSSPVQISTSSWTQVSAGRDYTIGIKLDNTLWSWGLNTRGQLGLSDTAYRSSPVQIGTGYWNNVNAGSSHTTALADNNTLYVWGDDNYGQ